MNTSFEIFSILQKYLKFFLYRLKLKQKLMD